MVFQVPCHLNCVSYYIAILLFVRGSIFAFTCFSTAVRDLTNLKVL